MAILTITEGFHGIELTGDVRYYLMAKFTCVLGEHIFSDEELQQVTGLLSFCDLEGRRKQFLQHFISKGFSLAKEEIVELKLNKCETNFHLSFS